MLRNLSASSADANSNTGFFTSYLRGIKEKPYRIVSLLAIFVIPGAALAWWYYSVAMSLGAVLPMRTVNETSGAGYSPQSQGATIETVVGTPEPSPQASSITSENVDLKITSDSENTNIEIDGEPVAVPESGSSHQVIENEDGKTTVDIQVDSSTSGTNKTRSSTNINLRSSSSADVDIKSKESY